jgi:N-6 DNA Methylase
VLVVTRMERLADRLAGPASELGGDERLGLPLAVAGLGMVCLGAELATQALEALARHEQPLEALAGVYKELEGCCGFLAGHLAPLTGWLGRPSDRAEPVARTCASRLAAADLPTLARTPEPHGTDVLGVLYSLLHTPGGRRGHGAIYTPMPLAYLLASLADVQEGATFCEPCCGSGALLIATAKAMRDAGRDPTTVAWTAIDIDPMAVALTGINAVVHRLGEKVRLVCGDALALPDLAEAGGG